MDRKSIISQRFNFKYLTSVSVTHKNHEEAQIVLKLARLYQSNDMSYRIITPYDSQRNRIEKELKQEGLKWDDKVFRNIDSFQGS